MSARNSWLTRLTVFLASLGLVSTAMVAAAVPASASSPQPIVTGWLPYWTTSASLSSYTANADLFSDVSPFWHDTANGSTPGTVTIIDHNIGQNKAQVMATLRAQGKPIIPSITDGTSKLYMSGVLQNPATRAAHVNDLVNLVMRNGYDGLDLDYEKFAFTDGAASWTTTKPAWVAFVTELAAQLHARGKLLTAAVPTSGYWVYDFEALGRVLDSVRIMAYDYSYSVPGPTSPIWWFERETDFMLSKIPGAKLRMGVPTYGRVWVRTANGAPLITNPQGQQIPQGSCPASANLARLTVDSKNNGNYLGKPGAQVTRDPASGEIRVLYVDSYSDAGKTCLVHREAWLSDAQTAVQRTQAAVSRGAAGVAFWTVGGEDPGQWAPIRSYASSMAPQPLPAQGVRRIKTGSAHATVTGNLTVVSPSGAGYLTAWSCADPRPTTSVSNFTAGQIVAAFVTVQTNEAGEFCVYSPVATHIIWDQNSTTDLSTAVRLADTRVYNAPIAGGQTLRLRTRIPNTVVYGNLTAVDPRGPGFATVWNCEEPRPGTSNLNFKPGDPTAAYSVTTTDSLGYICIYTSATTHLIWDQLQGGPAAEIATPRRIMDTRSQHGRLAAGETIEIPTGAASGTGIASVTAVLPQTAGQLRTWDCSPEGSEAASSAYGAGDVVATLSFVPLSASGSICVQTSAATDLVVDFHGVSTGMQATNPERVYLEHINSGVTEIQLNQADQTQTATLTVSGAATAGYVTVYNCRASRPNVSSVNFTAGTTTSNAVLSSTDESGKLCLYSSAPVTVALDRTSSSPALSAKTPTRLVDTRTSMNRLPAGGTLRVSTGKPKQTVMGTLTVTEPLAGGFTTVFACDEPRPNASVNNFVAGETTANTTVVKTDSNGDFCIYSLTPTHVIWDQVAQTEAVSPQVPSRLIDTRRTTKPAAGGVVKISTGKPNATIFGNLTVTDAGADGFTTIWPCNQSRPNSSVSNYRPGKVTSNFASIRTDSAGDFCIYTLQSAQLIFDQVADSQLVDVYPAARLLDTRSST